MGGKPLVLFLIFVASALGAGADMAGAYNGEWSGASGASGKLHIELQKSDEDDWKCSVTFTLGEDEYKTKMKSVKVDGAKLEVQYEFELGGSRLESTVTGKLAGKTLEGKYHTVTVADRSPVDEGSWKAASE